MSYVVKRSPYCIIIDDNCLEEHLSHSSRGGRYPYSPTVSLNGNTITVTLTNDTNASDQHTFTVNASGSISEIGDRISEVCDYAYEHDGLEWGNLSKNAYDEIMKQVKELIKSNANSSGQKITGHSKSNHSRSVSVSASGSRSPQQALQNVSKMTNNARKKWSSLRHSYDVIYEDDTLEHHGILGMKWGVRRYQNPDGSLTDAGRKHYGRNYTIHELKKNVQNAKTYEEKKAAVTANKVNRITKTPYRRAATTVATSGAGLASGGAMAGLMAAGLISVNPLLPVAALVGGVAAGKTINAGRDVVNMFRNLRAEQIDRKIDKQHFEESNKKNTAKKDNKGMIVMAKPGELPASTRLTGKEESDAWKAIAKQYESQAKASGSSNSSNSANSAKPSQERSSNSRLYTPEQQKSKMERAKSNHEYDMYFLEAIQNTKMNYDNNKSKINSAYKEYLKDPDKFFTDPDFDKKYPYA